jgi:putative SOS response-associated peptidase YedK
MCGRFTLTRQNRRELAQLLGVDENDLRDYRARYNIAPTDQHFVVTSKYERRTARTATWGLVNSWATDNSRASQCINAKAETLEERRAFREAFFQRRCLVPADGFYEWRGPKTQREPVWIHPTNGGLLLFAGLYEAWQAKRGDWQWTFTIITTVANALLKPIHDRMPVILNERAAEDWMNPNEAQPKRLKSLLLPAPEGVLLITPASPSVNSVKNDGPELLDNQIPQGQQLRLI